MTGYFKTFVAAVALAALPGLSGCLGGGGGSTAAPAAQMPREPAPEPMAEPAADPDPKPMAEPASGGAAFDPWGRAADVILNNLADVDAGGDPNPKEGPSGHPGPWTQVTSSVGVGDRALVSPLPDGSGIRVTRSDTAANPDYTVTGEPDVMLFESSGGFVSEVGTERAIFARTAWDSGDDGNWTSWGWWLEFRGADFVENAPDPLESAAGRLITFADGREFRGVPERLPQTGTARYRGPAMGVFASATGPGGSNSDFRYHSFGEGEARSLTTGEFTGSVDWTMTYTGADDRNADAKLLGEIRIGRLEGVRTDYMTGARQRVEREFPASGGPAWRLAGVVPSSEYISREEVRYYARDYGLVDYLVRYEGSRPNRRVVAPVLISGFGEEGRNGASDWHGRLSSVTSAEGHPRSLIGVFKAGADGLAIGEEGNGTTYYYFAGAFLAPLVE